MSVAEARAPRREWPRRIWVDLAVLSALSIIGVLGFEVSYADGVYLVAGIGGLVVGAGAGLVAGWLGFGPVITTLLAGGVYFLLGTPLAMREESFFGVLPTMDSLYGLAIGAVFGWADIVTLSTPVEAPSYIAVVPYAAAFVVGLLNATFASRWLVRRPGIGMRAAALVAPAALYVTGVLTGTEEPYLAAVRGVLFAATSLVWLSWRVSPSGNASLSDRKGLLRQQLVGAGIIAASAVVIGTGVGIAAAPSPDDRFVLREEVVPPFDPTEYPSPLSGFRKYAKNEKDPVLFTVTGLKPEQKIRLATMDAYTGKLWTVTDTSQFAEGSGAFGLIGHSAPPADFGTVDGSSTIGVTIVDYRDYWLPGIGYPRTIDFGPEVPLSSTALRYNPTTGIAVVTDGVTEGMTYTITADLQDLSSEQVLDKTPVAAIELPADQSVPDVVPARAQSYITKDQSPYAQLTAIQQRLFQDGYLSHGDVSTGSAPSRAGHGADRISLLLDDTQLMIGDGEQFAAAFALMARSLGYPARVVLGFAPEVSVGQETVDVHATDVSAWVEVPFEGVGWIPFYPTPDDPDKPQTPAPKPQSEAAPQVRQPPRTPPEQDDLVAAVDIEQEKNEEPPAFVIPDWVWTAAASLAIPLVLYFVPLLVIGAIKRRRRSRRRSQEDPVLQAAGAWDELVDAYAELGYEAPRKATRVQLALGFEEQFRLELAARESERSSAGDRKQARLERSKEAEAKAGAKARAGSILDETIVRAKGATAWRPGVTDVDAPLPAIPGLRDFAVHADAAVFSGTDVDESQVDGLWAESDEAVIAALQSVSWFRRRLSRFRIRPKRDIADALVSGVASVVPRTSKGVVYR